MNKDEFEVLQLINSRNINNQRALSKISNFSLGKTNKLINNLIMKMYLTEDFMITDAGEKLFEENKVKQWLSPAISPSGRY